MNPLVTQAHELLRGQAFEYAVCGGLAIDMFLGYESRMHGDIDILAFREDRDKVIRHMQSKGYEVYEMLGGGKCHHITGPTYQTLSKGNIFCRKDDCELMHLSETSEKEIYRMDFKHIGQTKLNFMDFLFDDKSDKDFLYTGNHEIKLSLNHALLFSNGIPFLAPELCLLYKSTDIQREGYQKDYEKAMEKMSGEQKLWLNNALISMYPDGHKWIV